MPDKKSFKDIHGKTRVGKFLKEKAPDLLKSMLELAGGVIPGAEGISDVLSGMIKTSTELDIENQQKALDLLKMDLDDISNARDMYKSTDHEMADNVAQRVIKWNLWIILIALVVEVAFVILVEDKVLIAIISSAVGGITTALLQERQQIINFFFGSSLGSKQKTLFEQNKLKI